MPSIGSQCEIWFKAVMVQLRMVDQYPPSLQEIRSALLKYLNQKTHKALRHLKDESDWEEWLDLALKVDCLIRLENNNGELLRIGVDVTANRQEVMYKLELIESHSFQLARKKLGISKHWIVLVDPDCLPSRDWIVDRFYTEVDNNKEIAVLEF